MRQPQLLLPVLLCLLLQAVCPAPAQGHAPLHRSVPRRPRVTNRKSSPSPSKNNDPIDAALTSMLNLFIKPAAVPSKSSQSVTKVRPSHQARHPGNHLRTQHVGHKPLVTKHVRPRHQQKQPGSHPGQPGSHPGQPGSHPGLGGGHTFRQGARPTARHVRAHSQHSAHSHHRPGVRHVVPRSPHSGEIVRSTHSGEIVRSTHSGEIVRSPHSGEIVRSTHSGEIVRSPHSGEIVRSPHSGEIVRTPQIVGDLEQGTESQLQKQQKLILGLHKSLTQLVEQQAGRVHRQVQPISTQETFTFSSSPSPLSSSSSPVSTSPYSTPSSSSSSSLENLVTLSTAEIEDLVEREVIVIDLTKDSPNTDTKDFVEVRNKEVGRPQPRRPKAETAQAERPEPLVYIAPDTTQTRPLPNFSNEFTSLGEGPGGVKRILSQFARTTFGSARPPVLQARTLGDCEDLVSDCYEDLLDSKIGELEREMRRLELHYWGPDRRQ